MVFYVIEQKTFDFCLLSLVIIFNFAKIFNYVDII
jgi:hypothetical protein